MGLTMRRRLPVLRLVAVAAVAVAGMGYHMGKQGQQPTQVSKRRTPPAPTKQPPPAYTSPLAPAPGDMRDLDQLVKHHDSGALTDQEFAAAKSKLLGL